MTPRHETDRGRIYEARAEAIYPLIAPGSVQLVMCDGPYGGLAAADWDQLKVEELPGWYRPHIAAWGTVCAPSASVYVCGTDKSASILRPEMKAAGWSHRVRITWDKGMASLAGRLDTGAARSWPDVTEVYDLYQRDALDSPECAGVQIQYAAGADERNWIRPWLCAEWKEAGLRTKQADEACGVKAMASRHYFPADQWWLPTLENYLLMGAYAAEHGAPRARPYLVHPAVWPGDGDSLRATHVHLKASYSHLRSEHDHLRASHDHLRAEFEAMRVPFTLPPGVTNVWSDLPVAGKERLRDRAGKPLHSCQKPLKHFRRMILASTRPGSTILEPFGGSLRVAVACEQLSPAEARRYVCVEVNGDGVDYLGPAIEELEAVRGQSHLFGAAPVEVAPAWKQEPLF